MANRRRSTVSHAVDNTITDAVVNTVADATVEATIDKKPVVSEEKVSTKKTKKAEETKKVEETKKQKYAVGSIVYISKDADADLNGFKLFPQYKKYTYTVEAYNDDTGVYSLRRLNLSLKLKEELILAPSEKSDSPLIRRQF